MMDKIGIIILNYNTWKESINCIESIFKYCSSNYKIYFVDNKSSIPMTKEFQNLMFQYNDRIKYIVAKNNSGYSAGNNIGLNEAMKDNCNYFFICNSDVLFVDNTIEKMIRFMKSDDTIGIVGPQIYDLDGKFMPFNMLCKLTAIGKIKNMMLKTPMRVFLTKFRESFYLEEELTNCKKVFGVSGCCFLVSKKCLEYLYPLDEQTFLYEEEYIIGTILEKSQFDIYIIPDTRVIHAHGASTQGITKFSYKCLMESEQYYLKEYLHTNVFMRIIIYLIRKLMYFFK